MNSMVMDECETPTLPQVIEFKYERTPTMILDANRLQEAQNLLVNRINVRCFTPTTENFQSPGFSPIGELAKNLPNGMGVMMTDNSGFQKPLTPSSDKKYRHNSSTFVNMQQQQQQQQSKKQQTPQQRQQQQQPHKQTPQNREIQSQAEAPQQQLPTGYSPDILVQQMELFALHGPQCTSESPLLTMLNSTPNYDMDCSSDGISPDISSISINKSKTTIGIDISNLLDRTLNVVTLLRSVGLEQYIDLFNEKDLDLQQFLNISYEDLQQIGVRTHEHRQIIMDLLNEFNDT